MWRRPTAVLCNVALPVLIHRTVSLVHTPILFSPLCFGLVAFPDTLTAVCLSSRFFTLLRGLPRRSDPAIWFDIAPLVSAFLLSRLYVLPCPPRSLQFAPGRVVLTAGCVDRLQSQRYSTMLLVLPAWLSIISSVS
jgi:hypothetical protein